MIITNSFMKLTIIAMVISFLFSCNTDTNRSINFKFDNNKIHKMAFLSGDDLIFENIEKLIEISNLNKGGYVVIIPTSAKKEWSNHSLLQTKFYNKQIVAVHILDLDKNISISRSEMLTIKNAKLICFIGNNEKEFSSSIEILNLKEIISDAYTNGTVIAGLGNCATILGPEFYIPDNDEHKNFKLTSKPGFGLFTNTIIYELKYQSQIIDEITSETEKNNMSYLGIDKSSTVLIKNSETGVVVEGNIKYSSNESPGKEMSTGNTFKLPASK